MTCLALSDVVVSDGSHCLAEALLFEMPGSAEAIISLVGSLQEASDVPSASPVA